MNDQTQTPVVERQIGYARRSYSSQTIVEFAIVLPLLLLLFLGIIEFARAFQSYLTITNSARYGVRYAVTGEYNPAYCSSGGCVDPEKSAKEDAARIPSIHDEVLRVTNGILLDPGAASNQPEYFHQVVCSSRTTFSYDRANDQCIPGEDAGNPEDGPTRVMVAITYNHPAIVPLINVLWPYVQMHAERTGILESFRVARVVGLPLDVLVPTLPATNTSTPTVTPIPTDTATPTPTSTNTPTSTPTNTATPSPTPGPDCSFLQINNTTNFYFDNNSIDIPLTNLSPNYQIVVYNVDTTWSGGWYDEVDPLPGNQFFDLYAWNGSAVSNPPNVKLAAGGIHMNDTLSAMIGAGSNGTLSEQFTQSFTSYWDYYHLVDFDFTLRYRVGSLDCSVALNGRYGPNIVPVMPASPITGSFSISAAAVDPDPDGSINWVNFEVRDSGNNVVYSRNDTSSPYCLRGNGNCSNITVPGKWPGTQIQIQNGTYWVYIQAKDNDDTVGGMSLAPQQYTRVMRTFTINVAPTPTPTITQTPSKTLTPTITRTSTNTPIVTPSLSYPNAHLDAHSGSDIHANDNSYPNAYFEAYGNQHSNSNANSQAYKYANRRSNLD